MKYSSLHEIRRHATDKNDIARNVDGISQNLHLVHSFIEVVAAACEENEDMKGYGTLMMAADLLTQQILFLEDTINAIYRINKNQHTCSLLPALILAEKTEVDIHG